MQPQSKRFAELKMPLNLDLHTNDEVYEDKSPDGGRRVTGNGRSAGMVTTHTRFGCVTRRSATRLGFRGSGWLLSVARPRRGGGSAASPSAGLTRRTRLPLTAPLPAEPRGDPPAPVDGPPPGQPKDRRPQLSFLLARLGRGAIVGHSPEPGIDPPEGQTRKYPPCFSIAARNCSSCPFVRLSCS